MPQRKDLSTWSLYMPLSLSRMTVPNQPNNMKMMIAAPTIMTVEPAPAPFRKEAKPPSMVTKPIEPTIGQ